MEFDPRLLVVADDRLDSLCEELDRLGWRTVTARSVEGALAVAADLSVDAALVELESVAEGGVERLRRAAAPRYLPILGLDRSLDRGLAPGREAEACDLTFSTDPHPLQLAIRLEQMTRAAVAEEEFVLRRATFAAHGVDLPEPAAGDAPMQILTAGAADRRFLALSNALAAAGAEAVAAPTPYTAFDYLHERPFDAAVLWGGRDHAPALSIAAGMRRNTRLYHIPLTLYLREAVQTDLPDLFERGFADVAAADTPEEETARRVLALARSHRRRRALRRALDAVRGCGLMDPETGLFSGDLFAAHLARIAAASGERNRPLSLCVLRVPDNEVMTAVRSGGWLERAMPQIGAMVSRLVRVEDTAARLSAETFALALPATGLAAARLTGERIAAVIACTAFDAGPNRSPFVVELDIGVAELAPGDTPASLLERASMQVS